MSTSPDSFPAEEPQRNKPTARQDAAPNIEQTSAQTGTGTGEAPPAADAPLATSTLPPEAQGETNGGPLGCCLGVTIGLLLSLSIALLSRFYADPLAQIFSSSLSLIVRIVMILIAIIAIIVCGYFGWKIGKKAYREYDPPVLKDRRKTTRRLSSRSKRVGVNEAVRRQSPDSQSGRRNM